MKGKFQNIMLKNILKFTFQILTLSFLIFSCSKKEEKLELNRPLTYSKDSVFVPEFDIIINLSKKAEIELKQKNESIIVWIEFVGRPEVLIPENYKYEFYNELNEIALGEKTINSDKIRNFKVKNSKVSKDLIKLLVNKTYKVRINVISARKSSKNNLLFCDGIEKNIDSIKGKTVTINGKLISEM
jgi:hypothetical protein